MLGINNAGSRQISNSKKEITKPEDLKGMNIRVPGANIFIDMYRNYFGYPVGRGKGYHYLGHEPQDHEQAVP